MNFNGLNREVSILERKVKKLFNKDVIYSELLMWGDGKVTAKDFSRDLSNFKIRKETIKYLDVIEEGIYDLSKMFLVEEFLLKKEVYTNLLRSVGYEVEKDINEEAIDSVKNVSMTLREIESQLAGCN